MTTVMNNDLLAGLRAQITECDAESRRFAELAECKSREARALRVRLAREQHQLDITPPPPPLEVRLRQYAMGVPTFTEDEAAEELGAAKAKLHRQLATWLDEGRVACTRRGRQTIYAWLAPDADGTARPRHAAPENVTQFVERGGTVAGSGRVKMSGRKDVDQIARAAAKGGATVTKLGNGHIEMTKDGKRVRMSSTPRASGMSKTKKDLQDQLGIAV